MKTEKGNQMKSAWYNYVKKEHEHLAETPTDFRPYIPQYQAAQNMYTLLIEHMGYTPIGAALEVLSACVKDTA